MRLSEKQQELLKFYKNNEGITYEEASKILNKSVSCLYSQITRLVNQGYLEKDFNGKIYAKKTISDKVKSREIILIEKLENTIEGLQDNKDWNTLKELIYITIE